jgi:GAF domain-containing protein
VIQSARAENREITLLKRDLPAAPSADRAVELLLDRLQPMVPAVTLAMYVPLADSTDLYCAACAGLGAAAIVGARVPIGERVTGWVFATGQTIANAEAALELSESVRRASPVALTHALATPMLDAGRCTGVVALFGAEPFSPDHARLVETAVSLLPRHLLKSAAS